LSGETEELGENLIQRHFIQSLILGTAYDAIFLLNAGIYVVSLAGFIN
jgi:hypothetical protein